METLYICVMDKLRKGIEVRLLKEAEDYFIRLDEKVQLKFLYIFEKVELGIKGEWFEKLKGTDGIFEFRYRDKSKFYRIFGFWDGDDQRTLILGTHGFDKKSNKTPSKEIKKAEAIMTQYFESKDND